MTVSYNQDIKNESRERLVKHAIKALTVNRRDSYLVSEDHFNKVTERFNELMHKYIGPNHFDFHNAYNWMFYGMKNDWLEFYETTCQSKKAADLKVLYLSGPEPLNDIDVLCNEGVRLENIWAIESEKEIYESALQSLIDADIHIKIHKGKLEEFFELVNHEFDIIYYDACSPIISEKGSPLDVLKQIFANKRLTGLSALITNFAEPGSNYNWGDILGCWFGTKETIEVPYADHNSGLEMYEKTSRFEEYSQYINENLEQYYDSFITHFIPSFAAEIIPMWQTVALGSIQNSYLLKEDSLFKKLDAIRNFQMENSTVEDLVHNIPHYLLAVDAYPLLNWARLIRENLPAQHTLNLFLSTKKKKTTLEDALYVGSLLKRFEESDTGFKTFILDICSDRLKAIITKLDFFDRDMGISCDIPMKNLLIELLLGLYGYPYIAHAGKTLSIKYKAKETWMYSNVFVLDQCRYLYDYLPTIDLWENFFNNWPKQTIIRGCIDNIYRNHFDLNSSFFKWGFLDDRNDSFGLTSIMGRENINDKI